MAETTKPLNIYQAITRCMEEIGAVGKNDLNKQQGFKYRGIDAVMNAINPALVKNHIFIVPEVLEQNREERTTNKGSLLIYSICKIRYTFYAEDGSSITAVTIGEGMDSGDKATNKAMAVAFKYACFQVFCIPTEELMDDPDKESPAPAPKKKSPVQSSAQEAPASVEQMRELEQFVNAYADMCEGVTTNDIWGELKRLFGFAKTSDLTASVADKAIQRAKGWYERKQASVNGNNW